MYPDLYEQRYRRPLDVVDLGGEDAARACAELPVGLVDGALEDEDLEVDVGEGDGQEVEAAFVHYDTLHLAFYAGRRFYS